jgi:dolichol-phosphate mannosyltransferase
MINSLTIIIPIYNEEENINRYLSLYVKKLLESNIDFEIIIVESNSKDNSREKLNIFKNSKNIRIFYEDKKRGYGSAIKLGLKNSSKKFFTVFPIDNQYSIFELINICQNNDDNIITFRKSNFTSGFKNRRSFIFKKFINFIFNFEFKDINSIKIIKREIFSHQDLYKQLSNNWIIDLEFLILLSKYNLKTSQIGINLIDRECGKSKVRIGDNFLMIYEILISRLKFFF